MIVHSYFTDGMFEWSEVFLKSFKYYNGEEISIVIDTRNLKEDKINYIKTLYNNLEIINKNLNIDEMAKKAGINTEIMESYKKDTEFKKVTPKNKVWKLMIAGDDRIKSIRNLLENLQNNEIVIHFDIDVFFISKIDNLYEKVKNNDFSTIFRIDQFLDKNGNLKENKKNKATAIGVQGYNKNYKSMKFLDTWIYYIDKILPSERKKGYAQEACYLSYLECDNYMNIGNLKKISKSTFKIPTGYKNKAAKEFKKEIENWK